MKLGIQNLTQLLRLIHQQIILPDDYAVGYRSNLAAILCIRTGWTQVRVCPPRASPVSVMACTNHQVSNSAVADMFDVAFLPPSYLTSAMEPLSINCLVSSDGPGKMFTVEIPPNKNVSILKTIIKDAVIIVRTLISKNAKRGQLNIAQMDVGVVCGVDMVRVMLRSLHAGILRRLLGGGGGSG